VSFFSKVLIANRGDRRSEAKLAAKAHVGAADGRRRQNAWRAQRAAILPRR